MIRQSKRLGTFALMLIFGLLGSTSAWSQGEESLETQLKLTSQQKQQIDQLRQAFKTEAAPIKVKLRGLQKELSRLEASNATNAQIREVLDQKADEEIRLALLLRKFKQDYLEVLTNEQKKLLQSLKS
jgi:Spy/CpxP family protein refolding chaperone